MSVIEPTNEPIMSEATTAEALSASPPISAAPTTDAPMTDAATREPTGEPASRPGRPARKVREGVVLSAKMDKTAVVAVVERVRHAKYGKFVQRTKKLYAHDETNDAGAGDRVRIMETRPTSKLKRWRLVEVLERAR